jgi:hypothetical protein
MPAAGTERLADVVAAGNIVVTVPWAIIAGDNEGIAGSGTATYTIAVNPATTPLSNAIAALCDDLDRCASQQLAVVT